MSRKRDTNWSKDEISVLLDSIMEITRTRAENGKKTNSREVFDFAAKKMADKGHTSRAEREKCRTKWKKMKEEFTHAKRSRDGDIRYKEAPGIQPFYERMEEFINGNYDNISPHSTIVRRTSNLSQVNSSTSSSNNNINNNNNSAKHSPAAGMRSSARLAANTNGTSSIDNNDTSSSNASRINNIISDYPSTMQTSANTSPSSRLNSRLNSNNTTLPCKTTTTITTTKATTSAATSSPIASSLCTASHQEQAIHNGQHCTIYTSYGSGNGTSNSVAGNNNNSTDHNPNSSTNNTSALNHSNESLQPTEQADISYRVSSGCRQITIFGDHDVDIKFRGDCVTINKIDPDFQATET